MFGVRTPIIENTDFRPLTSMLALLIVPAQCVAYSENLGPMVRKLR